jgi:hypothetical protein
MLWQQILHRKVFYINWYYKRIWLVRYVGYYGHWAMFSIMIYTQTWAFGTRGGLSDLAKKHANASRRLAGACLITCDDRVITVANIVAFRVGTGMIPHKGAYRLIR